MLVYLDKKVAIGTFPGHLYESQLVNLYYHGAPCLGIPCKLLILTVRRIQSRHSSIGLVLLESELMSGELFDSILVGEEDNYVDISDSEAESVF